MLTHVYAPVFDWDSQALQKKLAEAEAGKGASADEVSAMESRYLAMLKELKAQFGEEQAAAAAAAAAAAEAHAAAVAAAEDKAAAEVAELVQVLVCVCVCVCACVWGERDEGLRRTVQFERRLFEPGAKPDVDRSTRHEGEYPSPNLDPNPRPDGVGRGCRAPTARTTRCWRSAWRRRTT